jgi:hypothetical protein
MKVWATAGFLSDLSMASGSLARAAVGFVDRVVWVRQVSQRTKHINRQHIVCLAQSCDRVKPERRAKSSANRT